MSATNIFPPWVEAILNSARNAITVSSTGVASYTTPAHSAVAVATTSTSVLASNANRLYLLLVNDSDTDIYINLGGAAVASQGIRINANGGSYEMNAGSGNVYTGAIHAIHASTGTKTLLVTEGT